MGFSGRKVRWDSEARRQLKSAVQYIKNTSPQNAIKVKNDILAVMHKISPHPEIFSLDKYKNDNDGTYRAFEKHRYRVTYRILPNEIRILRIRHTSMEPLHY